MDRHASQGQLPGCAACARPPFRVFLMIRRQAASSIRQFWLSTRLLFCRQRVVYPSLLACRREFGPASLARQVPLSTTAASAVTRHPPQRSLPARVRPPRFTTPRELAILRQLASLSFDALLPPCDAVGTDFFFASAVCHNACIPSLTGPPSQATRGRRSYIPRSLSTAI